MQSEMTGQVDFERINGDDPGAKPIMQQYEVRGYPTLVWLDSEGKVIDESSYEKEAELRSRIERLLSAH